MTALRQFLFLAERLIFAIIPIFGLFFFTLGVFICVKQVWAVYVSLVITYMASFTCLLTLNVCPLILLIVVLLPNPIRIIRWANRLQAAGIELTAKPR